MVRARRLWGARDGVAALEFGLVAPVLIAMILSMTDITGAVIAWWQIGQAADAIGLIATNFATTTNSTNILSDAHAAAASTAVYALRPALRTASPSSFGVVISSVIFTPSVPGCTARCTYRGNVAWSVALQGAAAPRACGTLAQAADTAAASPTTLPASLFTAAPVLVVDVTYTFSPLFSVVFGSPLRMMSSAYLSPRTGDDAQWVRYTGASAAKAECPGYRS